MVIRCSSLFNTVMQDALEDDWARWREKGMGISLGVLQPDCLSNLRFEDDVLLFSTSLEQLRSMMCDFKKSTEVGLKIFLEKTKILSNQGSKRGEVLPVRERAKYLGQTITFEQMETIDVKSRARAAWASYTTYRQELTSRAFLPRRGFTYLTWSSLLF